MKTRMLLLYVAWGAASGGLGGLAAALSAAAHARHFWGGFAAAALAGALVGAGGAAAALSRRALVDAGVAAAFGAAGYLLAAAIAARAGESENIPAFAVVAFALVFSYALGASHMTAVAARGGRMLAAFFAAIAGLVAVAAAVRFTAGSPETTSIAGAIFAGALFGAAVWGAIGFARRISTVDPDRFRV